MNYFLQAFKKIFTYQGRARRAEYGWFLLINFLLQLGTGLLLILVIAGLTLLGQDSLSSSSNILGIIFYFISTIYNILTFFVMLSLTARRLHDLGWSGWWQAVVYIVPFAYLAGTFALLPIIEETSLNPVWIVNVSFWLILLGYFAFHLILLFKDGQKQPNKYGESPKYPSTTEG